MAYTTTTVGSLLELAPTSRKVVLPGGVSLTNFGLRRHRSSGCPRDHPLSSTSGSRIDRFYRRDNLMAGTIFSVRSAESCARCSVWKP